MCDTEKSAERACDENGEQFDPAFLKLCPKPQEVRDWKAWAKGWEQVKQRPKK